MSRVLRSVVAATVALIFTGVTSALAASVTAGAAADHCARNVHPCNETTIARCCCGPGAHELPAPVPPTDQTSLSKTQTSHGAFAPVAAVTMPVPFGRDLDARATHRAGPPISLAILHASLLL